jgi:hypothetical protein
MANTQTTQDSLPPSLSSLRRQMQGSQAGAAGATEPAAEEMVDFDNLAGDETVREELAEAARPKPIPDEIESLLQRYQSEKARKTPTEVQIDPGAAGLPPLSRGANQRRNGSSQSAHSDLRRANGLPALTTNTHVEMDKLRTENADLKKMLAEVQQFYAEHDPQLLEQQRQEVVDALAAREVEMISLRQQVEEWNAKLQTHRLVPSEDEMAKMSDELEKERCQLAQERKQLETQRAELKDDEETLMKQMREMEVGLARDRAELARQRTELQRLHSEVKHEMEQMERGDANMKERLSQFQRRHTEVFSRSSPSQTSAAAAPPLPPAADSPPPPPSRKPRGSGFRRFFRQD